MDPFEKLDYFGQPIKPEASANATDVRRINQRLFELDEDLQRGMSNHLKDYHPKGLWPPIILQWFAIIGMVCGITALVVALTRN